MKSIEFKMEREGLIKAGDTLPVTEYELSNAYYYVLGRSYAMSGNISKADRVMGRKAKVTKIEETDRGFYVTAEISEDS